MKKFIAGVAGATIAVLALSACSAGGTAATSAAAGASSAAGGSIKVSLIAKGTSDYWTLVKNGAEAAGKDLGVEVTYNATDTENEGDKQLNLLTAAINDKPQGVAIAPQDGAQDGAPTVLDQAKAANIPVAVFDTPLKSWDGAIATIASDNEGIGAQAAENLSKLIGGKGKVAMVIQGVTGTAALRRDGFANWMKANAPDIQVVDIQNGEADPAKSRDKAQAILQANPDLAGFAGTSDYSTIAIADEVAAKGGTVKVVGVDASPDVLTLLSEGKIDGIVTQNPYQIGYKTVSTLVDQVKGKAPAEKTIVSEAAWVTKDNMNNPEIKQITG
ncbi:MAG TPA: substrate-binding domain-containing protein [Propionicimonas sp.]|nr:substrate-binding domain-containing protein [Propionicimonas sp.]HQD97482.1 substrate-binding domain-containing protein [Propionicimonas sp.]